jgi:hypothetical protein
MLDLGEIISYYEMCSEEGVNLQRGMNYHLGGYYSVILMSKRSGAPYSDRTEDDGRILIYEGHDMPTRQGGPNPKLLDQPMYNPKGSLCQNGLFFVAAQTYKLHGEQEIVKVYEKIKSGIWTYNGFFLLVDAWKEKSNNRKVYKFKLQLLENQNNQSSKSKRYNLDNSRLIPSWVKREVWKRDNGRCVICGETTNLHFDHIIPYSKGGTSLLPENIQLLCAKHNLEKRDKIN